MKLFKCGLIISAFAFFIFACTQSNTTNVVQNKPATSDNTVSNVNSANNTTSMNNELASARNIFEEKCVACHKENGEGGEANIEGKKFKVPNYKSDKVKNTSDEKLLDYIENGDDEMPSFKGKLTTEEMKSLVKFIRTEFQGK